MENELIVTRDIVEKYHFKEDVDAFNEVFPRGAKVTDIPKLIPYLEKEGNYRYRLFAEWLLNELPFNNENFIIDGDFCGNIFYNGPVWVKRYAHIRHSAFIKGTFKINARLSSDFKAYIYAKQCIAYDIKISHDTRINADVKVTERLTMSDRVIIEKNVVAKEFKLGKSCWVCGNVKADSLWNSGVICKNVEVGHLDNGGEIWGKIDARYIETDSWRSFC